MQSIFLARAIIVALLCATGFVGYSAAEAFYLGPLRARDTQMVELVAELDGLFQRGATARSELAELRAHQRATPARQFAIVSANSATSSTKLQESVRNAVARSGGAAITSQANVENLPDGSAKITILVRARFTEIGMLGFVRALESLAPPVLFESLEAHPVRGPDGSSTLEFTGVLMGFHSNAN